MRSRVFCTMPGRCAINMALAVAIGVLIVWFAKTESCAAVRLPALASFAFGVFICGR